MNIRTSAMMALVSATVYAGPPPGATTTQSHLLATANKPVFEAVNIGRYEVQQTYVVDVRPVNICDTDGSNCGAAYDSQAIRTFQDTNGLHYRSDSKIRFRLADSTNLNNTLNDDLVNNRCFLANGISVVQTTIPDGNGGTKTVDVLANNGGTVQTGDVNNDGKVDGNDNDALCIPNDDPSASDTSTAMQAYFNAVPVFVKNGHHKVKWDGVNQVWRYYRSSGGSSSCEGNLINMPRHMGYSNLFSHESGHYLCTPHPFFGYAGGKPAEQEFLERVSAKVTQAEVDDPASLYDANAFIRSHFDVDVTSPFKSVGVYLNDPQYQIKDTAVDPGPGLWKEVFGEACGLNDNVVAYSVPTSLPGLPNLDFSLAPDRRNIMSYFKGCFPEDAHFSNHQIRRAEGAVKNHRSGVAYGEYVGTWINDENVTIPLKAKADEHWATSHIKIDDSSSLDRAIKIIIGVDIKHPTGGLFIEAVAPDGQVFPLQNPSQNRDQISGDVKTLFYLDAEGVKLDGIWKLRVKDENVSTTNQAMAVFKYPVPTDLSKPGVTLSKVPGGIHQLALARKIDDWQIQFEFEEFGFLYIPQYEIDRQPRFPPDPWAEFEHLDSLVKENHR